MLATPTQEKEHAVSHEIGNLESRAIWIFLFRRLMSYLSQLSLATAKTLSEC
jgi:hypothetical protein